MVITGCIDLLDGKDVDPTLIHALGGPPARWAVSDGVSGPDYWLRVWATRGLLWAWDDRALPVLEKSLLDPEWRVREMAARVAGRHQLDELLLKLEHLKSDPHRRVRAAAERAVVRIATTRS